MKPLYLIVFEDASHFVGGTSYFKTKWLEIPNKKIKNVFYRLPDGNCLCLPGYEKYYHMVEATNDLNGKDRGLVKINYAYIMGKRGNKVDSYRITLFETKDSRYKIGDIVRREFDINSERIKGLNLDNWR